MIFCLHQCRLNDTEAIEYDGQLVTHEILSEKKFDKILADKGV